MVDQSLNAHHVNSRSAILRSILVLFAAFGVVGGIFAPDTGGANFDGLLGVLTLIMALALLAIQTRSERLAGWLTVLGGVAAVSLVWLWHPHWGMPCLYALPVLVGIAVLGWEGSLVAALLASGLLAGASSGMLAVPGLQDSLLVAAITVWGSFGVAALMVWQHDLIVTAALRDDELARQNLSQARERQVELNQALEDLDLAHRELIRLTDLLTAAREAVESTRRAKEEFVANVSHELRTPLNMIIGFSDEIIERPKVYGRELPRELIEDISVIRRNSQQLASLVDDVLDLVEADTGFTRLSRDWTSITEIVRDAVEAVRPFFERKGLSLTVESEYALPRLSCDPTRIRQVVLNVLSNAARFTEQGGAGVRIVRDGDNVVVSVADSGLGMERSIVNRMFEPFQQADPSLRRRYGGTGLGLAISKRLVELHGGEIWIESQVGTGTTVSFSLPTEAPVTVGPPASSRWFSPYHDFSYQIKSQPSAVDVSDSLPSIAVVDHGDTLLEILTHYMSDWQVTPLAGLEDAIRTPWAGGFRAVVVNNAPSDQVHAAFPEMPHMDLTIPIVHCQVPSNEDTTAQMGVSGYLIKPVHRDALIRAIEDAAPGARRVLVVDDDKDAQHLFGQMLGSDYEVARADDGVEALDLMRSWSPDIVLLDLLMPNLDGTAVLAARAEDPVLRRLPVVIVSAHDQRLKPIKSTAVTLTRQGGLSARDLATAVEALASALPPRFAAPEPPENHAP